MASLKALEGSLTSGVFALSEETRLNQPKDTSDLDGPNSQWHFVSFGIRTGEFEFNRSRVRYYLIDAANQHEPYATWHDGGRLYTHHPKVPAPQPIYWIPISKEYRRLFRNRAPLRFGRESTFGPLSSLLEEHPWKIDADASTAEKVVIEIGPFIDISSDELINTEVRVKATLLPSRQWQAEKIWTQTERINHVGEAPVETDVARVTKWDKKFGLWYAAAGEWETFHANRRGARELQRLGNRFRFTLMRANHLQPDDLKFEAPPGSKVIRKPPPPPDSDG